MGRSKGKRWSLVQVWEPGQDAAVPRPARDEVVVFGGRPRETWREAAAHALLGASYFLLAGGGMIVPILVVAPMENHINSSAADLVIRHLWLFGFPLLLVGSIVGVANTFTRRTALWWWMVGAGATMAAGCELCLITVVWGNPYVFFPGLGVFIVGTVLLAVLCIAGAFPAMTAGPFLEHPDTPASLSLVGGRRGQVWGPAPRTRTDWAALAVSWLAVPGVVLAVGLLAAGSLAGAVLVAVAALTLPRWWAGSFRRARARRLDLTPRALTWAGVAATVAVTALCWWGGLSWASAGERAESTEMEVAGYVALATWLSGVWLAFGRRRPGPGLTGAWLVVLVCAHAGNVFLGLSHRDRPVDDDFVRAWRAYGFISVVGAALVWQLRRWRPIPGVPDPPVTRSVPPEESDPVWTADDDKFAAGALKQQARKAKNKKRRKG